MSETPTPAEVTRDTGVVDRDNPWPGLAAFRESDSAFFHGRDDAIKALTELVARARLSVLYGVSGLGKTSLLQAGLFPRARTLDLFPLRIRLGLTQSSEPPAEQVHAALTREAAERRIKAPAREGGETLWEFFYRKDALWWNDRHHIVTPLLVFDQFEEIFTLGRRSAETTGAVQQFLGELRGIILGAPPEVVKARCDADPDQALRYSLSRCPVRVLFSFREDYLAEFLELRDAFPAIGDQNLRLLRMSAGDALAVIRKAGGHLVEDAVARRIVEIIAAARPTRTRAQSDLVVDPALLSVFCRELNNERRSKPQEAITNDLLQDKQERILEKFYTRSFAGLDPRVQVFVEDELLLPDSAERNSVAEQVALRRPGVTAEAIESLIERRLLRRDERDGPPRLELTHDVLVEPTRRSRDLRKVREAEEQRLAAARATEAEARKAADEALERERQELLLQVERVKVERAASELQHQTEKRRRVQYALAVVAALALIAGFWAYREYEKGTRSRRANANAMASKHEADGRDDIALAYLGHAATLDPDNVHARGRLVDSLLHRTWPVLLAVRRQEGPVRWAQFIGDGTQILTVAEDKVVRLWSVGSSSEAPVRTLGAPAALARVDVSGRYALAATAEGAVEVWETATGRTLRKIEPATVKKADGAEDVDGFSAAAFDRSATRIATATRGGVIRLWSVSSSDHTPVWTNAEDPDVAGVLQFNEDGSRLLTWSASQSGSGLARILDASTGQELATFSDIGLVGAQFSPNGAYLVTASIDKARLWKLPQGAPTRARRRTPTRAAPLVPVAVLNHERAVYSAQFNPDGDTIVTASEDGTACIWDVTSGGRLTPPLSHRAGVSTAFFSADGSRVVTASKDNSARVWDAETGSPLTEPLWHERGVGSAMFSADGQRVVTASDDGSAHVWDVRAGSMLPDAHFANLPLAQFAPDGNSVLLGDVIGVAQIWSLETGQVTSVTSLPAASPLTASPWQFNSDGAAFLTVDTGIARTWTTATAQPLSAPMDHGQSTILSARFTPDGRRIATIASDGNLRFWDARSGAAMGTPVALLRGADPLPVAADLSRDVTLAALATNRAAGQNGVALWNVSQNPPVFVTELTTPSPVKSVSFDPAHNWLLGILDGATALLWPVGSSPPGSPLKLTHEGMVASGRFSPNGGRIVTLLDSTAKLWTFAAGAPTAAVLRHDLTVNWADVSPDDLRVATASLDGTAKLWDAVTGNPASLPLRHGGSPVIMSRFSADGEKLVTTSHDGGTRVWHVPVGRSADVASLAALAEAVSGYTVSGEGREARLDDPMASLDAERRKLDRTRGANTLSQRIGEWMLADRWNRNISPFSATPIARYLMDRVLDGSEDGQGIVRAYAGHPGLRGKAGGQQ